MAQTVKLKRTSVANRHPTTSHIEVGELAFNSNDKSLFIRGDSNAIVTLHDEDTLHIDHSNNRVGINKTSPNYRLDVGGNIHSTAAYIDGYIYHTGDTDTNILFSTDNIKLSTGGNTAITVDSSQNVGIGDDSPDFKLSIRTPAIPSGSTYAWPLDLSRTNTDNRGLSFGVGASGGPHAIGAHNGDIGIGQTYGTDSNGLPQFYETLSIVHDGTASVGKVGIGTSSPDALLHVKSTGNGEIEVERASGALINLQAQSARGVIGTDSNHDLQLKTNGSGRMTINTAGNVGIGDTTPDAKLTVQGDVLARDEFRGEVVSYAANQDAPYLIAGTSGYTGATTNWNTYGFQHRIKSNANGSPRITIDTSIGEAFTVTNNNRVGIGTSSPTDLLTISGDGKYIAHHDGSNYAFQLGADSSGDGNFILHDSSGAVKVKLYAEANAANYINNGGNVGIGTTSPSEKLDVNGTITISGDIKNTKAGGDLQFNGGSTGYVKSTTGLELDFDSDNNQSGMNFKITHNGGTELFKINNSGAITFNQAYTFPTADGSANQVLQTDGSGNLTFGTAAGGGVSISNNANNRVLTGDGTNANAEANLTFDGSTLGVTGTISSGEITTTAPQFKYVSNTDSNVGLLIRDETYISNEADITASRLAAGSNLTLGLAGQVGINAYIGGVNKFSINSSGNATFAGTISSGAITSSSTVGAIGIKNSSNVEVIDLDHATYTIIKDPEGNNRLHLGDSGDTGNYYSNTTHHVRSKDGATYFTTTNSGGFNVRTGTVQIDGTTVISSSRNLTNIGTISSGAITANGSILGGGNLFLRSYNNDPKGIFFRDGFEYGDTNQYNLSITVYDDGDGSADGMNINAYDGIFFNVQSGTTPSTAFRVLNSEVRSYKNFVSTGTVTATSFSDGTISGITFIDEDSFSTNSATRVPTQQSIKAYVDAQVAGVVDTAPAALNTLNELAAALGDDASFSTTTSTALGNRLRVDTASQGLTGTQQANAITNLGITATKAELNYVDGVTSNIQTQLNGKQASGSYLTGNQTITLSGDVSGSGTTSIAVTIADDSHNHVISNVDGLQTALNGKLAQGSFSAGYTGDMDSLTGFRIIRSTSGSNRAFSNHHNVLQIPNTGSTQYEAQIAFETGAVSDGGIKFRNVGGGSWGSWYRLYHEGHKPTYTELGTMAYSNLTGTPTIPTNNNQLTNGAGYTTNTGTVSSLSDLSITSTAAELNKLDGYTGSVTELNYLDTLHATGVTSTEFDYLDGVTSNIQTQLNTKLTSSSTSVTNKLPLAGGTMTGSIAMANFNITGVNQLEINDPGEGIIFKSGASGDMQLRILDDSSDNILQYSGTNALFDVAGTIRGDALRIDKAPESLGNQPSIAATFDSTGTDGLALISVEHLTNSTAAALGAGIRFKTGDGSTGSANKESYIFMQGGGNHALKYIADKNHQFYVDHHDNSIEGTGYNDYGTLALEIAESGEVEAKYDLDVHGNYKMDNTTIIDTSKNLVNIGTISSGAISATSVGVTNIVTNKLVKFNGSILDDSNITDTGSAITLGSNTTVSGTNTATRFIQNGSVSNDLYAADFSRSGTGITTPDIWGSNNTLVIGTSSSVEVIGMQNSDATFYGDLTIPSKIRHSGDTDNYFSFSATDTQSFVTGNSTRLQISNSLVRFNQEGTNQDFQVFGQNDDNLLYVDASADAVGIGTATPQTLLHVKAADTVTGVIKIEGGKNTVTSAGEINSQLDFGSNDASVNGTGNVGGRIASITENTNGAHTGMAFSTFTQSASPDLSEKVRIAHDGNVGIGTSSPDYSLDIESSTASMRVRKTANDATVIIESSTAGAWTTYKSPNYYAGDLYTINGTEQYAVGLLQGDDRWTIRKGRSGAEMFTVLPGGNVGIGTATPTHKLEVSGSFAATTKSFDIEHPSKKGMRLHHGVVEGPEHSVYVRGKSKEKVILLPDYWVDLIHEDTITIQLTAIGSGQDLYVEDIKDNKVFVNGDNYFYYIQAERKDVEKFEVEYNAN